VSRWLKDAVEELVAGFSLVAGRIYDQARTDVGSTQYFSRRTRGCQYHVMDCEHFFHFLSDFREFGYTENRMEEKSLLSTKHSTGLPCGA
jgi:hypothetical protein